jgi:hypothetical protein
MIYTLTSVITVKSLGCYRAEAFVLLNAETTQGGYWLFGQLFGRAREGLGLMQLHCRQ